MNDELNSSLERHWSYDAPPVSALAAVEAIARLGSFAAASRELNRTPSAISHAVREIEKQAGVTLFHRVGRQVSLTDIGHRYVRDIEYVIAALKRSATTLRLHAAEPVLRISAPPLFVATVLIPNMARFEREHPPFKLKIETTNEVVDFDASDIDVAIRFAPQQQTHLFHQTLPPVWVQPVCSATYRRKHKIKEPADIAGLDLIAGAQAPDGWAQYFRTAQVTAPKNPNTLVFDTTTSSLEAARQGLGVALAIFPLVQAYPGYGKDLVPVGKHAFEYPGFYRLVCRKVARESAKVSAFSTWLQQLMHEAVAQYTAALKL